LRQLVEIGERGIPAARIEAATSFAPAQRAALAAALRHDAARRIGSARALLEAFRASSASGL